MKSDGGPAFPHEVIYVNTGPDGVDGEKLSGMTLRDYFAAKCMAAIIEADGSPYVMCNAAEHARMAYANADLMLAERVK